MEAAVAAVLNKFLGDWLENLNSEQLNLSVWSGQIRLGPIQLKSTAIDKLGLPFKVKFGSVRRIAVDVDWIRLTSKPLVIEIEDVFVLATTKAISDWNPEIEKSSQQLLKASSLEQFELLATDAFSVSSEPGFVDKLVSKIVDNVQIKVSGVCIRLEDEFASVGSYAVGLVLGRLEAVTCSSSWKPQFTEDSKTTYKLVRIDNLAMFLDYKSVTTTNELNFPALAVEEVRAPAPHSYILAPASVHLRVTLNKDNCSFSKPQIYAEMTISGGANGPILMAIETPQLTHGLKLAEFYSTFSQFQAGVLAGSILKWGRPDDQSDYRAAYIAWVKGGKPPSGPLSTALARLEADHSYEEIASQRSIAIEEMRLTTKRVVIETEIQRQAESPSGFFSGVREYFTWDHPQPSQDELAQKKAAAERDLLAVDSSRKELSAKIKAGKVEVLTSVKEPSSYIKTKAVICIPKFQLTLSDQTHPLLTVEQDGLSLDLGLRPATMVAAVRIGAAIVLDRVVNSAAFPYLVKVGEINAEYDQCPEAVTEVKIKAERLVAVANLKCFACIAEAIFAAVLQQFDMEYYRKAAGDKAANILKAGQDYLQEVMQGNYTHQAINISAEIAAPQVLIPLNIAEKRLCLVSDFGEITVKSRLAPKRSPAFDYSKIVDENLLYDFYLLKVANMRIGVQWQFAETGSSEKFSSLFRPSDISLTVGNAIARDVSNFPALVGRVLIENIAFSLSDQQLLFLLQLQEAITREMELFPTPPRPPNPEPESVPKSDSMHQSETEVQSFQERLKGVPTVLSQLIEVNIGRISLGLDKRNQAVLDAVAAGMRVYATMSNSGFITAELSIADMRVRDRRNSVAFAAVVSKPMEEVSISIEINEEKAAGWNGGNRQGSEDAQFLMRLRANLKENFVEALVQLANLRATFASDFVQDLLLFPQEAFETIAEDARLHRLSTQNSHFSKYFATGMALKLQSMRAARATQYYSTRRNTLLTVIVENVELWIPEDSRNAGGKVVAIVVDSTLRYNSNQTYNVHMDDWGAVIRTETTRIDDEATLGIDKFGINLGTVRGARMSTAIHDRDEILKPSRLSLDYLVTTVKEGTLKTTIEMQLESLDVEMGVRDIVLFQALAGRWASIAPPQASEPVSIPLAKPPPAIDPMEYHIDVKLASVEATMLDDTGVRSISLFYFELNNVSAALKSTPNSLAASCACGLKVNYYNHVLGVWEPIVEEWAVEVQATQPTESEPLKAVIRSEAPMNVNLSCLMGETVALAMERLSENADVWMRENALSSETASNVVTGTQVVYKLKNRLDAGVEAWIEGRKTGSHPDGSDSPPQDNWRIPPGKSHKFGQSQIDRVRLNSVESSSRKYASMLHSVQAASTIALKIEGMGVIPNVIVDDIGTRSVIVSNEQNQNIAIVIDISAKEGEKLISIESHTKVLNNTELEVRIKHADREVLVKPGREFVMPLEWLMDGRSTFLVTSSELVNLMTSYGIVAFDGNKKLAIDYVVIKSGTTDQVSEFRIPHQRVIIFNSPYTVHNLTPSVLSLFYQNETDAACSINPGGVTALHSSDPNIPIPSKWIMQLGDGKKLETDFVMPKKELEHYHLSGDIPSDKLSIKSSLMSFVKSKDIDLRCKELIDEKWHGKVYQVYCQFWIVNRTPFTLEFTGKRNFLKIPAHSIGTVKDKKSQMRVRVAEDDFGVESEWSKPFNIRTVGIAGSLQLNNSDAVAHSDTSVPNIIQLGVKLENAQWPLVKSVIVKIQPRFIVTNYLPYTLLVRQYKKEKTELVHEKQSVPYQLENAKVERAIEISRDGENWSSPFHIEDIDDLQVRFKDTPPSSPGSSLLLPGSKKRLEEHWWKPSQDNGFFSYVRVIVSTEDEATLFVNLMEPVEPEYRVENETEKEVTVNQFDCSLLTVIKPHSHSYFAYDNHCARRKKVEVAIGEQSEEYSFDKIKEFSKLLAGCKVQVKTVGVTRVLVVRPDIQSEGESQPGPEELTQRFSRLEAVLSFKGLIVSLLDEKPRELFVFSLSDINITAHQHTLKGKVNQKAKITIGNIQLDDMQAKGSHFPVMVGQYVAKRDPGEEPVPFLQFRAEKEVVSKEGTAATVIEHYKEVGLLMQPMQVQVHQDTILGLMGVAARLQHAFAAKDEQWAIGLNFSIDFLKVCPDMDVSEPKPVLKGGMASVKAYFEFVNLNSMKFLLSFRSTRGKPSLKVDPREAFGILSVFSSVAGAFVNITESPLNFSSLILLHSFQTFDALTWTIMKNYIRQGAMQFYKIIGSSDMIGNPIGLIDKLGTGVFEFFSEPVKGLLKGPKSFAEGVGKGVKSLVSGVISGGFGSVSRITGSLYSVVRQVGGEEDNYDAINRNDNIAEGIYHGVKGGLQDLAQGVTGLFLKPIRGAKRGGVTGFLKGMGTGLLGVVTAPLSAVLRVGTSVTAGIAHTATLLRTGKIQQQGRIRFPRQMSARKVIEPYNEEIAQAQELLKAIPAYCEEQLVFYIRLDMVTMVLVTTHTAMEIYRGDLKSSLLLREINRCDIFHTERGLFVLLAISQRKRLVLPSKTYAVLAKLYGVLSVCIAKFEPRDALERPVKVRITKS